MDEVLLVMDAGRYGLMLLVGGRRRGATVLDLDQRGWLHGQRNIIGNGVGRWLKLVLLWLVVIGAFQVDTDAVAVASKRHESCAMRLGMLLCGRNYGGNTEKHNKKRMQTYKTKSYNNKSNQTSH